MARADKPLTGGPEVEAAEGRWRALRVQKEADLARVAADWDARIAFASDEVRRAREAEAERKSELAEWSVHNGGANPVGEVYVLFRTKWEWADMIEGRPPRFSIDEKPRWSTSLRWEWSGVEYDDIAAYRIIGATEGGDR